ncbi:hypothetical protein [Candidatus Accumulibacter contiguus]
MATAALLLDHRVGNGREIVAAAGLCAAEHESGEGDGEQAEGSGR